MFDFVIITASNIDQFHGCFCFIISHHGLALTSTFLFLGAITHEHTSDALTVLRMVRIFRLLRLSMTFAPMEKIVVAFFKVGTCVNPNQEEVVL